ncbi:flagellar hook-associated protein FlgK [Desulfovibrio sp. OttesenSCG-928-C06]|nr:flagellar hook-associated protein FlgK [Desulfovibrio sp. OttesenSCG-928-C06]
MASSVNSLLSIGNGALFGSQTALQTTGNNIANVNTAGYSRQTVRFEAWPSLDYQPGQMGQGVRAAEVMRHFDKFVERSYLNSFSTQNRWSAMAEQMRSVESVFNESTGLGINNLLSEFWNGWEKLTQFPDDMAAREALIGKAQNLVESMRTAGYTMGNIRDRVDGMISEQIDTANSLMEEIASLNRQINMHSAPGNNPNSLLDLRDQKVRELSAIIDVDVIDKGDGNYIVNTKAGHTLVDGTESFKLNFGSGGVYQEPRPYTEFDGTVGYNGTDGYEYTLEFVDPATVGTPAYPGGNGNAAGSLGNAQYRVSLDGGRTWIKDENGNDKLFTARDLNSPGGDPNNVKDLDIYFQAGTNNNFHVGDKFVIVPKSNLEWVTPTGGPMNISPQQYADGTDNYYRATGGSLGGLFMFRDYQLSDTEDQFDMFAQELIWQVNRIHSQGSGLENLQSVLGSYSVANSGVAMGADNSGLIWKDKLQEGNFTIALYDQNGNPMVANPGSEAGLKINFDPTSTAAYTTSGPPPRTVQAGSLEALVDMINNATFVDANGVTQTMGDYVTASIVNNQLKLDTNMTTNAGGTFGVGNDTSGVLAGMGINTFFTGTNGRDIAVNSDIVQNHNLINAAHINGAAEANRGDATIAKQIADLAKNTVEFSNWNGRKTTQTLGNFYGSLVSSVGSKTQVSEFQQATTTVVANELEDRQSEVAGVNLDEEMTNLIRFQSSYKAAAKLITTADQMLQTIIGLKQ